MKQTLIQSIFATHTKEPVTVDAIVDLTIDIRAARDFGGANVVKHLQDHHLTINDPKKTLFTFDCNPGGCDQKYAQNQHLCRQYARQHHIPVYDINAGIGTHLVIDQGLITPGHTFVSTDSHANILGAIAAFGQGMGDIDIAYAFAHGTTWFKVPPTTAITLKGTPSPQATAKDIILHTTKTIGANGLLGSAAELHGPITTTLNLDERLTIASMGTEMAAITLLFPTTPKPTPDPGTSYTDFLTIDIDGLTPQISRPGHPEDVTTVKDLQGTTIDSGFIGSCTNGRIDDLRRAAHILKGKKIAPGRILKIVPATDTIWNQALHEGLLQIFKDAGALIGSAGCAGCAAGQIGQTGAGEITISTGNRNFTGKQGKGDIYLASPETVAASLIAGYITTKDTIPTTPSGTLQPPQTQLPKQAPSTTATPLLQFQGNARVIPHDNIDTDAIYHNRYLTITNQAEMGQYTFAGFKGHETFAKQAKPGDILVTGKNLGAGSSRQQAVDCFKSLGISLIIADSFGAIYERNAINSAFPILTIPNALTQISNGDHLTVDLTTGIIQNTTTKEQLKAHPFSSVQRAIYLRGGLLGR
jgi:3-isopropylmalate dehydratase small subunit